MGFVAWPFCFLFSQTHVITKQAYGLLAIATLSVGFFSWISYQHWGASQQVMQKTAHVDQLNPNDIIKKMENHLAKHPESAQGWYLLGKLYFHQARYSFAVNALKKAYQLRSNDLETKLYYAQALFFQRSDKAHQLLTEIVAQNPNEITAINLLALDAYQKEDYQKAIQYWEKLIDFYPPDSDDGKVLLRMIALSQKKST